jgi:hypothetical protein
MVWEGAEEEGWKWEVVEEGELKVEEFDCVGFGWTGPSFWRRAAREGSEASRLMAFDCNILELCSLIWYWNGRTAREDGLPVSREDVAFASGWT